MSNILQLLREWLVPALTGMPSRTRSADAPNYHPTGIGRVSVVLHEGRTGSLIKAWIGYGRDEAEAYRIALTEATRPAEYDPVVECACGRTYDAPAWSALRLVGYQEDTPTTWLEMRACPCGSTRTREVARAMVITHFRANPCT
jgi:hypothetical protein